MSIPKVRDSKGEKFLNKAERKQCWDARDLYWNCKKAGKTPEQCSELRNKFEEFCPKTWVVHFDRKYDYERFKENMHKEGGFDAADQRFRSNYQKK